MNLLNGIGPKSDAKVDGIIVTGIDDLSQHPLGIACVSKYLDDLKQIPFSGN